MIEKNKDKTVNTVNTNSALFGRNDYFYRDNEMYRPTIENEISEEITYIENNSIEDKTDKMNENEKDSE